MYRRTIISDTLTNLRDILDKVEGIKWETEFVVGSEADQFYTIRVYLRHSSSLSGLAQPTLTSIYSLCSMTTMENLRKGQLSLNC